jgi:hypothetical protein
VKTTSSFVPRVERLEDRSIPGSLLGLADSPEELFGDLLAPSKRPASAARVELSASGLVQAAPIAAGQARRAMAAATFQATAPAASFAPAVAAAGADPLGLALAAAPGLGSRARRLELRMGDATSASALRFSPITRTSAPGRGARRTD